MGTEIFKDETRYRVQVKSRCLAGKSKIKFFSHVSSDFSFFFFFP